MLIWLILPSNICQSHLHPLGSLIFSFSLSSLSILSPYPFDPWPFHFEFDFSFSLVPVASSILFVYFLLVFVFYIIIRITGFIFFALLLFISQYQGLNQDVLIVLAWLIFSIFLFIAISMSFVSSFSPHFFIFQLQLISLDSHPCKFGTFGYWLFLSLNSHHPKHWSCYYLPFEVIWVFDNSQTFSHNFFIIQWSFIHFL